MLKLFFSGGAYLPILEEESRLNRHGVKIKAGLLRMVDLVSLKVIYECYVLHNVLVKWHVSLKKRIQVVWPVNSSVGERHGASCLYL